MPVETQQRLSQVGPSERIPENLFGSQFVTKIVVKCP
jgi:hypothetical protein